MQRLEETVPQVKKQRALNAVLLTAVSTAVLIAAVLYALIALTDVIERNVSDVVSATGWREWHGRQMRRVAGAQGWNTVGILLLACSAVCGGISIAGWCGLRNNRVSLLGTWIRCHTVWLATLCLAGAYMSVILFAARASTAAGLLIALLALLFAGGVACSVAVRRFFSTLFPGPWWRLWNWGDPWDEPHPSSVVYVDNVLVPPPPPPAAALAAPPPQQNPYASLYPSHAPLNPHEARVTTPWPQRFDGASHAPQKADLA